MMTMFHFAWIFRPIFVFAYVHASFCQNISDAERVYADKFISYNTDLRPVLNLSTTVEVDLNLKLVSIKDFDEVNEKVSILVVAGLSWIDQRVKWNPKDYDGVRSLTVSKEKIWTPFVILTNAADQVGPLGKDWKYLRILNNGVVYFYPMDMLNPSCKLDTTHYPWDTQQCEFEFATLLYTVEEVKLRHVDDKVGLEFYSPHGVWDIVDSDATRNVGDGSLLGISVKLQRRPFFIVVNVILPMVIMSALNLVVFLTPAESGERISYCFTVLLSIAVFMTLVGDNLPKSSNPMPILCFYLTSVLVISTCIVFATIFSLRFYFRSDNEDVTSIWKKFAIVFRCRCKHRTTERKPKQFNSSKPYENGRGCNQPIDFHFHNISSSNDVEPPNSRLQIQDCNSTQQSTEIYNKVGIRSSLTDAEDVYSAANTDGHTAGYLAKDSNNEDHGREADVSWKDVSVALDHLFFVVFLLLNTGCSTYCFLLMTGGVSV